MHQELMQRAIAREGDAHRAVLAGEWPTARTAYHEAATAYRASWEAAPPGSWGRLVGLLKTAVLAGGGREEAAYVRAALDDEAAAGSAPGAYARALAALVQGDDEEAARWAAAMRGASEAFARTADVIDALAARDDALYATALETVVRDFEGRETHLTGVAVADTALVLEVLARARGLRADVDSPVLPALDDRPERETP